MSRTYGETKDCRGCRFWSEMVARTWLDVPRTKERSIKKQGGASRICPICKAAQQ